MLEYGVRNFNSDGGVASSLHRQKRVLELKILGVRVINVYFRNLNVTVDIGSQ